MSQPDEQAILELFKKAAWEFDQRELDDLDRSTRISDLGIDSVSMVEIVGYLEEDLDFYLPDEKLMDIETIGDLTDIVMELTDEG
jgi:acyl carrier protein